MTKLTGPTGYRVWLIGTADQFTRLDQTLASQPDIAQKILVYVCPTPGAAHDLIRLGRDFGLEGELLGEHLTSNGYLPRHHARRHTQERKQIHDTYRPGEAFTAKQIAHLTGIKHPNALIRSMLSLGQLCRHGRGPATYYTLGPKGS